jgi:hypothetical protein
MEFLIPEGQQMIFDRQSTGFNDIGDAWNSVNMLNNLSSNMAMLLYMILLHTNHLQFAVLLD